MTGGGVRALSEAHVNAKHGEGVTAAVPSLKVYRLQCRLRAGAKQPKQRSQSTATVEGEALLIQRARTSRGPATLSASWPRNLCRWSCANSC